MKKLLAAYAAALIAAATPVPSRAADPAPAPPATKPAPTPPAAPLAAPAPVETYAPPARAHWGTGRWRRGGWIGSNHAGWGWRWNKHGTHSRWGW